MRLFCSFQYEAPMSLKDRGSPMLTKGCVQGNVPYITANGKAHLEGEFQVCIRTPALIANHCTGVDAVYSDEKEASICISWVLMPMRV